MGFKDAGWAYELELPMMQKVVLAALCLRTDDKTHQTLVGQERIASMIGSSAVSVRRALGALEAAGVITRTRRFGRGGYRTSDLTTVNVDSYRSDSPQGSEPTRQTAHKALRSDLPITQITPTDQSDRAEEVIQSDHSEGHSEMPPNRRGTRIPESFTVTPEMAQWARERCPLVDGRLATERFINHFRAKTGRDATKLDWPATWRNWLLKDQQTAQRNPSKSTPMQRVQNILALVPDEPAQLELR